MPYTKTDSDAKFVSSTGDDMSGSLGIGAGAIPTGTNRLQLNAVGSGTADPSGVETIFAGADGNKPLVLQQNSASQTANLLELEASNGTTMAAFGPTGNLGIGAAPSSAAQLVMSTGQIAKKAISISRVSGQTANILEVMDSNGTTTFFSIAAGGMMRCYRGVTLDKQSFAQNGGTIGTILTTQAFIRVTGSGGGTLNLPASGQSDGQMYWVKNAGSSSFTLSGNGLNIDGSASVTLAANASLTLRYDSGAAIWDTW